MNVAGEDGERVSLRHTRKRVHVHRRPPTRTRRMQRGVVRAVGIFVVVGVLIDMLHPRVITDGHLKLVAAGAGAGNVSALTAVCGAPRARRARVHSLHTSVVHERLLCWTPVERVALLHFADGARRAMVPASWARVRWTPVNPTHTSVDTRRMLAGTARIQPDSLYVEHTSGFTPALELQRAALQSFVAGTPVPLLASPALIASHMTRYVRAFVFPTLVRAAVRTAHAVKSLVTTGSKDVALSAKGLAYIVDRPFNVARRFATTVRARRNTAP